MGPALYQHHTASRTPREGYGRALCGCQEQLAGRPAADREQIFGETARSVFPIHA